MKRKHSERSEQTKSKPKCECCLKTIKSEADSCEFTAKIVKQFLQFTTLELTIKDGSNLICVTCKTELKYVSNLRTYIVNKNNSIEANESKDVSSSFAKKNQEHCRSCFKDNNLKNVDSKVELCFEKLTGIKLTKADKLCILCIDEFYYLCSVKTSLLEVHSRNIIKNEVNIWCHYCTKPLRNQKEMKDLTGKVTNQFKDVTGLDTPYEEDISKICDCCKKKLKFMVYFIESLVKNQSEYSKINCQCCAKKFEKDEKTISTTEKIQSQFCMLTNIKLLEYFSICFICKLKLSYVVRLQTYLKEQHKVKAIKNVSTDVSIEAIKNESGDDSVESSKKKARVEAPKKSTTVAPVEIKKKKKSAAPIEKSTYKNIVEDTLDEMVIKKRRTINYKSVVEESKEVKIKKTILDCPHCDKSFDVMKSLNHHLNVAHNNLNTVQCTKCNNWFKIKVVDVDDFISIFKEEIENGVCDSCSYRSAKKDGTLNTRPTKKDKEGTAIVKTIKVHKCTICDLVIKSAKNLDRHMIALHSNDRPKQCPQCPSAFKTTTDLGKHVRRVHEQLRNAQCPLCDKKFFGNDGVKLHIEQFHNNERNFKCEGYDECTKAFKNKYKLDIHVRYYHLKERNYPCTICGLEFFTAAIARTHAKTKHEKF